MTQYINIIAGSYRNQAIENVVFPLVKQFQAGQKGNFVTVDGTHLYGEGKEKIRVTVSTLHDYVMTTEDAYVAQGATIKIQDVAVTSHSTESDEEVMERIATRFEILHEMTKAVCDGNIKAVIVTGPPGVGKSFGVEAELERASLLDRVAGRRVKSEVIKGGMSDIGLYQKLYQYSDEENVLVFDDCDDIFFEPTSLNLLKAALDTSKTRKISWNKESSTLRREGIPESFNFKGAVIFITNLSFDNVKSKKIQDHLAALESRCHFIDLTLNTTRDKLLRIRQIAATGELFSSFDFSKTQEEEVIEFLFANQAKLREVSLRTALKLADLYKSFPMKWKEYAKTTVMKGA
jgi:predicted AAA+ superfamily ATPase